jgi:hypothetical protein
LLGLKELHLYGNRRFKQLPNLEKLVRLQDLYIHEMSLTGGLRRLRQLRKLTYTSLPIGLTKIPNLSGCEQLQAVDFSGCRNLLSLDGVFAGVFPAIRSLNLQYCTSLDRLPDLSGLRSLQDLNLRYSSVKLREEDICMLAALPLLRPVRFVTCYDGQLGFTCRLDVVRRKVLKWVPVSGQHYQRYTPRSWLSWKNWEERDLDLADEPV